MPGHKVARVVNSKRLLDVRDDEIVKLIRLALTSVFEGWAPSNKWTGVCRGFTHPRLGSCSYRRRGVRREALQALDGIDIIKSLLLRKRAAAKGAWALVIAAWS